MNIRFILLLLFFSPMFLIAQFDCDCCLLHTFSNHENFEQYFPSKIIKNSKIQNLTVEYKLISGFSNVNSQKTLTTINFDNEGFVKLKQEYHDGRPNIQFSFDRDEKNRLIKFEMNYTDENGIVVTNFPKSITDYSYPSENLLKFKSRNIKGEVMPDSASSYGLSVFDDNKKLIQYFHQTHYTVPYYHSETKMKSTYDDKKLTGTNFTYFDDTLQLIDSIKYNTNWQIISSKTYDLYYKKVINFAALKYDELNRKIYFKSKNGEMGYFTECPDGNEYELFYEYDKNGLLNKIKYKYADKEIHLLLNYVKIE